MNLIYGINPVTEALKSRGRALEWVGVTKERHDLRLQRIVEDCRKQGVAVRFLTRQEIERMTHDHGHQGVLAVTSAKRYNDLDDLLAEKKGSHSLIVVLDGIEDPHNLGAILRTADAAGVDGVVIPERRAVGVTGTVAKTSAGAREHLRVAEVVNIARAIQELKDLGVWSVGFAGEATTPYGSIDFTVPTALVLGAEGAGLRRLVLEKCDFLASIPM